MVDAMCFESSQEGVDDAGDGVDADVWAYRNCSSIASNRLLVIHTLQLKGETNHATTFPTAIPFERATKMYCLMF
jgi:hypothetical protein